jgi:hypothetical protein
MMKTDRLLHTDQISCFDEAGNEIVCEDSGQDGVFGFRTRFPRDRFRVINDTVTEDTWTGLSWHRDANLAEFPLSWEEAVQFVKKMNSCQHFGRSDWRLPKREELFTLISHQAINPCLPENHPFENVFDGYYWTQTECARLPNQAWYIHMGGARVYRGMKHGSYMVWPVAGSEPGMGRSEDRFVTHEYLIYDRLIQRTWLDAECFDAGALTWQQALDWIKRINEEKVAGYRDWRLPNIRELESLVDNNAHSPAIMTGYPPHRIKEGYWSSTTSLYEPRYAWVLYTKDGAVGVGYKPQKDFYLLAVRCGVKSYFV